MQIIEFVFWIIGLALPAAALRWIVLSRRQRDRVARNRGDRAESA